LPEFTSGDIKLESNSPITGGILILTRQSLSPALSIIFASDVVRFFGTASFGMLTLRRATISSIPDRYALTRFFTALVTLCTVAPIEPEVCTPDEFGS
jgi:hypothetical protein